MACENPEIIQAAQQEIRHERQEQEAIEHERQEQERPEKRRVHMRDFFRVHKEEKEENKPLLDEEHDTIVQVPVE